MPAMDMESSQSPAHKRRRISSSSLISLSSEEAPTEEPATPPLEGLENIPRPQNHRGEWTTAETTILRQLVAKAVAAHPKTLAAVAASSGLPVDLSAGDLPVDWQWVCEQMAGIRSRHQVLCKAVDLGLKSGYDLLRSN